MKIFLDGQFYAKEDAKISVFDHGLLYGDGVFEGIRFYKGKVFRLEEHIARLYDSARAICLKVSMEKDELTEAVPLALSVLSLRGCQNDALDRDGDRHVESCPLVEGRHE